MQLIRRVANRLRRQFPRHGRTSYAQCGEDLICEHLLKTELRVERPTYLDVGAHHPAYMSNTYFFYRKGCHGVCIEPDPSLFDAIRRKRPRDVNINAGVGTEGRGSADFYVMNVRTLNTFSKEEAHRNAQLPQFKIDQVIQVPLILLGDVVAEHFQGPPNLVSLDTEGFDLPILRSFDFDKCRPDVFCIETVEHSTGAKNQEIAALMASKNYTVYADTFINTIFVEGTRWAGRGR